MEQIEPFKPAENVDNALIALAGAYRHLCDDLLHTIGFWLMSIFYRCSLSIFLMEAAHEHRCSRASHFLVICGSFMWAMQRVQELKDIVKTWAYFRRWDLLSPMGGACDGDETSSVSETDDLGGSKDADPVSRWVVIPVLLIKTVTELLVSFSGGWFVLASETNEEVILNCLSAAFVSEIDEMTFNCFVGKYAKFILRRLPERRLARLVFEDVDLELLSDDDPRKSSQCVFDPLEDVLNWAKWATLCVIFFVSLHLVQWCPADEFE